MTFRPTSHTTRSSNRPWPSTSGRCTRHSRTCRRTPTSGSSPIRRRYRCPRASTRSSTSRSPWRACGRLWPRRTPGWRHRSSTVPTVRSWSTRAYRSSSANRARFRQRLAAMFVVQPPGPAAVLLLDLDRFKIVNDTLGHQAGDKLLVAVADRLRRAVGPDHLVARLGGDEFAILVGQVPDRSHLTRLAASVLRDIRQPVPIDGGPLATSPSLGIALAPEHADTPERMLACADVPMYHANRTGSPYHLYNPEQDRDTRYRLSLEPAR